MHLPRNATGALAARDRPIGTSGALLVDRERGIALLWCMAEPTDFAQMAWLTQVTSMRTCGDHVQMATVGHLAVVGQMPIPVPA